MTADGGFEILLVTFPGLEEALKAEAKSLGFRPVDTITGGVLLHGGWPDVWRANLRLRGVSKVLVRIASFRAFHLAQLDKRARKVPWADVLRPGQPVRVEVTCKGSRIYHAGAAAERIGRAITETLQAPVTEEATVCVKVRIQNDICTVSLDTSGDGLHKRGHKEAVNRAPMRETMAALFLRQCGYTGDEPVLDPMCGSGTFPIEAAEIACGLFPGRSRRFAFEDLATFDPAAWQALQAMEKPRQTALVFRGSDRDPGAVRMSQDNAERAGLAHCTAFSQQTVSELQRPDGPPGLVILNPPYGTRIGDRKKLTGLYRSIGQTLTERFSDWRVGIITTDAVLARSTGLPFSQTGAPVLHGGLRVSLYLTGALG